MTSPYYDQLRSLKMDLDFAPYGSPEFKHLNAEITELEYRAHQRMIADQNIRVPL